MTEPNPFQLLCAAAYGDGDHANVGSAAEAKKVGDTLFAFLMTELSDAEDCEAVSDAISRVRAALNDVTKVLEAFEEVAESPERIRKHIPAMTAHELAEFIAEWRRRES